MEIGFGDWLCFQGYASEPPDSVPLLSQGDLVIVVRVGAEEDLSVLPFGRDGQLDMNRGETLFPEEIIRLPLPPLHRSCLPPPEGTGMPIEPRRNPRALDPN